MIFVELRIGINLMLNGLFKGGENPILRLHQLALLLFIEIEVSLRTPGDERFPTFSLLRWLKGAGIILFPRNSNAEVDEFPAEFFALFFGYSL